MMRKLRVWAAVAAIMGCAHAVQAQTTVNVSGSTRIQDVNIRGGSYAAVNYEGNLFATRASTNASYVRRGLLDFDTASTIPAGSVIRLATLTLTVHWGGIAPLRKVGVYPVTRAFTASQATWDMATATAAWTTPGGDLGPRAALGSVPNGAGQRVVFDVTALVQANVKSSASRRTRVALVDVDSLTNASDSYRDYYPTEATTASVRPVLTVAYGGTTTTTTSVPNFSHVFVIVMENHEYGQIIGNASAPYINGLAAKYGLATNYTGVIHPSLPNYMAMTGGYTAFTTNCSGCLVNTTNIADQVYQAGRTWKGYFESMPAPCTKTDSGRYAQRHNPFVHYTNIAGNATRCANGVVPMGALWTDIAYSRVPNYAYITPNTCNDMHDCSVATGDAWLATYLQKIINSTAFANSVIFLTWDEGTTTTGGGGRVPMIVISPLAKSGYRSATPYNHYSLLRTIEKAWGMPALGHAGAASPMAEFFK